MYTLIYIASARRIVGTKKKLLLFLFKQHIIQKSNYILLCEIDWIIEVPVIWGGKGNINLVPVNDW